MLEGIEALIALADHGTVSEAAIRLRLTQSAVSKRIQALQNVLGFRLIEPSGRRVRLTARAVELVERARPLVAELRILGSPGDSELTSHFSLAMADSIASTWGPAVVRRALDQLSGIDVSLHAQRSVLIIESVRLGRFQIGLCTDPLADKELVHYPLLEESMVVVNRGFSNEADDARPLISIEATTAAWRATEPLIREHHPDLLRRRLIFVESFGAAAQMAKAGFGDCVIPMGLVLELGLDEECCHVLARVHRPVSLLTRKTVHQLASFGRFREQLSLAVQAHFSAAASRHTGGPS